MEFSRGESVGNRIVAEYISTQLNTIDLEACGTMIAVFLCEVIDTDGQRGFVDGYEITHRHFDEEYGVTVTPLDQFVEWR